MDIEIEKEKNLKLMIVKKKTHQNIKASFPLNIYPPYYLTFKTKDMYDELQNMYKVFTKHT